MATKARAVIGTTTLNGQLDESGEYVHVWVSHGVVLGRYRIERFTDSKLTNKTLKTLFTG